jgi:hypothetical protein
MTDGVIFQIFLGGFFWENFLNEAFWERSGFFK